MNVYLISENGKEIFRGTLPEVVARFEINNNDIYRSTVAKKRGRTKLLLNKYDVQIVGKWYEPKKEKKKVEEEPKTPFEIAVWALKTFGNTSVDFDPYPKLLPDMLEFYGLDCRVKTVPNFESIKRRGRKPKQNVHWYVEVAHAINPSQSV